MRIVTALIVSLAAGPLLAQSSACPRLLVSGYFSNVHVYDACSGAFERLLDSSGRIAGAQATGIGPDGKLYVVSEDNGQILRYDARSLEFEAVAVNLPGNFGGTGMVFSGDEIWVAGYNYDGVRRFSLSGQALGDAIAPHTAGLNGPDNGMTIGPDGQLYVPGYDSDNVIRRDPVSSQSSSFIAAGAGGLDETRGILFEAGGQSLLVSSEGNGRVIRYNAGSGAVIGTVISGLNRPTGIGYGPDGSLLVLDAEGVRKYDPQSYAARGMLAATAAGQVAGPTYLSLLPRAGLDQAQIGNQYWISGNGPVDGRTIQTDPIISTLRPAFGAGYDPTQPSIQRWGSLRAKFSSCSRANFSWDSTGTDSAGFGSGSYPMQRIIDHDLTRRCEQQGFDHANDLQRIVGSRYGGETRNG